MPRPPRAPSLSAPGLAALAALALGACAPSDDATDDTEKVDLSGSHHPGGGGTGTDDTGAGGSGGSGGSAGSGGSGGATALVWGELGPDTTDACVDGQPSYQLQVSTEGRSCTVCPAGADVDLTLYVYNGCPDVVTVTHIEGMLVDSEWIYNDTTGEDRGGGGGGGGEWVAVTMRPTGMLTEHVRSLEELGPGDWVFDIGLSAEGATLAPLVVPFIEAR